MKVILKEDIHGLGYKDDVVTVKDGYGRNYLIPQQKAVLATEAAQKVIAENLRQRAHKLAKIKADAEALAEKLNGLTVSVATKASEKGKVFGAVTSIQIAEALEKQGISIDKRVIDLKNPIKELGSFKVSAKLHKEVTAEFTVEVAAAE
ncbi:MAG: 50S ribosomal protein L9 [Paludibacteraceae bacterium]|nr:50S ribosomal protein L9 [Paludibacteraceae bacterium]